MTLISLKCSYKCLNCIKTTVLWVIKRTRAHEKEAEIETGVGDKWYTFSFMTRVVMKAVL